MKKTILIKVEIDTDEIDKSMSNAEKITDALWQGQVWVGNDTNRLNGDIPSVVAHELGHVINNVFDDNPWRPEEARRYWGNPKERLRQERAAWMTAGKMGVPLDQHTIDVGMGTHDGSMTINPFTGRLEK